jgi:cell envelope opacity-associated protein A
LSLSAIFSSNDLNKLDLHNIVHANDISSQFATIRPGKSLMIGHNISGELSHLIYKKNAYAELKATKLEDGSFKVELLEQEVNRQINTATAS